MPKFSWHALERLWMYGLSQEQIMDLMATCTPFSYGHEGARKTGYFDPASGLFVAVAHDQVVTVIRGVTPEYVERLKGKKS